VLVIGLLLPCRLLQTYDFLRLPGVDLNQVLLESMRPFAAQTRWMVTDDGYQAYPFTQGILTPPELAITSPKRIAAGQLSADDWFAALLKYEPEQAIFTSFFPFPPGMLEYLEEHYYLALPTPVVRHYVRRDLTTPERIARLNDQLQLTANFSAFIRSEPNNDRVLWQLVLELGKIGAAELSGEYFRRAIRLNPTFVEAHNSLAWILATHPDPTVRRPEEAIAHAETACALTYHRHPVLLNVLGAAYASAGRYADAVATAEKARAIADRSGAAPLVKMIDRHLELYRAGQPYRETLFEPPAAGKGGP